MRRKGDCETLLCVLWGAEEQHWGAVIGACRFVAASAAQVGRDDMAEAFSLAEEQAKARCCYG
ncbi:MAG: hypothetical protein G8D90_21010 [gamma proteobacterium symbiont of Clathrolucina costata]